VGLERLPLPALFGRLLDDHMAAAERTRTLLGPAAALAEAAISVLKGGGKVLLCGNGGSAADSQHVATELTIRFERKRRGLPAIALTTDTSALTAAGNDFGFSRVFARQVEALGRPGDMLIGISTSGHSENVVEALKAARAGGLVTACLSGRNGGVIAEAGLADHCLVVPSENTARIQEMHIFILHAFCLAIDEALEEG
jgi:D-sedoheptulose 7-phosphate isomerase